MTAIITDVGFATNPGATLTAATQGGNSLLTVRNFPFTEQAALIDYWRNGATKGRLQLKSPNFVEPVAGLDNAAPAGLAAFMGDPEAPMGLVPQDVITMSLTGGGAESDEGVIQTWYSNLPGISQVLKSPGDILGSYEGLATWRVAAAASATIGTYGDTAITTTENLLPGNRNYAVLGYVVDTSVSVIALKGPATGTQYLGGPGTTTPVFTRRYFVELSARIGKPAIPVFNTADNGATFVSIADIAASTAANVSLLIAVMPETWTP